MKYWKMFMTLVASAAFTAPTWGGVLASDGFESYSTGQLTNAGGNAPAGGTGIWTTPWQSPTNLVQWTNVVSRSMSYNNGSIHLNGGAQALEITPKNDNIATAQIPL